MTIASIGIITTIFMTIIIIRITTTIIIIIIIIGNIIPGSITGGLVVCSSFGAVGALAGAGPGHVLDTTLKIILSSKKYPR